MKSKNAKQQSYTAVMKQLKAAGSEQTRKTYARHGVTGTCFGVSYAVLKKLDKQVADDLELAEKLWASGNHDARVFACWVVAVEKVTSRLLDAWAKDVDSHALGGELVGLVAFTKFGAKKSSTWRKAKAEIRSSMGWGIVANLAMQPDRPPEEGGLTDDDLRTCLEEIEAKIDSAPNRTRSSMNSALIAIGCRSTTTKEALAVARRVGVIEVDRGDTACKTPVALDSIKKTVAHYKAKGKKPTDGSGGKRRRHC